MSTLETNSIGKYNGNNVSIDDALNLKSYSTTDRDALTSAAGDMIYNSTTNKVQVYTGSAWEDLGAISQGASISIDYLVVGGGGGACINNVRGTGGGGAGGTVNSYNYGSEGTGGRYPRAQSTLSLYKNLRYNVSIGAGGARQNTGNTPGFNGFTSYFHTVISIGGGAGGSGNPNQGRRSYGFAGACGGGSNHAHGGVGSAEYAGQGNEEFGYDGGRGYSAGNNWHGGGGGGTGGDGGHAGSGTNGTGGVGKAFTILSSSNATTASVGEVDSGSVYYGGGGGGAGYTGSANTSGGLGGGGTGNATVDGNQNGTANTGGGAGAEGSSGTNNAGSGGSGVVILRYPSSATINQIGGLTITTYTESSDKVSVITAGTGQVYWE